MKTQNDTENLNILEDNDYDKVNFVEDWETTITTASSKVSRFDLEQQILDCWNVVGELALVNENVLEDKISKYDTSNILLGIEKLYDLKFQKLFSTFEDLIKNQLI